MTPKTDQRLPTPLAFPDGNTGALLDSFQAFNQTYLGGVFVTTAHVNDDGTPDIIVGQGDGRSLVRVFDGVTMAQLVNFKPYPVSYTGGVAVAAADLNADGHADIITVQNSGGQRPEVEVFSGSAILNGTQTLLMDFDPFAPTFTGGAFVAAGDVNDDGVDDIIVSKNAGANPQVRVFSGADGTQLQSFLAFASNFSGGVSIGAADVNGDGHADIIAGTESGLLQTSIFSGVDDTLLFTYTASGGSGGLFVA